MNSALYLLKGVRIIDSKSPFHNQVQDILLGPNEIIDIQKTINTPEAQKIKGNNLHVSLGFTDLRANFNDPGNEDREDLQSGAEAALQGGFTSVALSPETTPITDNKAGVEYLCSYSRGSKINLLPIAAFSKNLQGEELSEFYDMRQAGAIAFNHGGRPLSNSALMRLALLYNRELKTPLQVLSYDPKISAGGQMHEGPKSTWLGLKGIPDLAETLYMSRDIALAEYTGAAIHFMGVSSQAGLELIRSAQQKGLKVSGDVNLLNLIYTDQDLESYNTNLKLFPPLREESDREALIAGLKDGSLTGIASDHNPATIEEKKCEFDGARFGAATLEGSFSALLSHLERDLGLERIVDLLSRGSRSILAYRQEEHIAIGQKVDLCVFDPDEKWAWNEYQPKSKAANYPFAGEVFKGRVRGTYCKGIWRPTEV